MAKSEQPPKKGPKMATAYKPNVDSELEAGLNAFAKKVHSAIEEARSKMSDEEQRAEQTTRLTSIDACYRHPRRAPS